MKRKGLTICMLLLPLFLMAAPITQEQALQKACEFMKGHPKWTKGKMTKPSQFPLKLCSAQTAACYYVFNVGEQQGFVVVSGDDRTPAILGYATNGAFDADDIPANMQAWLEDYEHQISMLDQQSAAQAPSPHHQAVVPLITSIWSQTAPYNSMCPLLSGNRPAFTGCAATAMAQVMNYHKYPDSTLVKIPAYNTRTNGIPLPAIDKKTVIDWDNMLDDYSETYSEVQQQAVAQLMMLCGQSIETDYTSYGSNAFPAYISTALAKYFGYDKNMRFLYRESFRAEEWDALIYHELSEQRPVIFSGQGTSEGHTFIIDGCDEDGFYHVNWGWGGLYNNYFRLSILDPYNADDSTSLDGYNHYQNAIVGIKKPVEAEIPKEGLSLVTRYLYVDAEETQFERQSDGTFALPIFIIMSNQSVTTRSYDIGCGIYNDQDSLVLAEYLFSSRNITHLSTVWKNTTLSIPEDLPDGNYVIKAICKPVGTDEWLLGLWNFDMRIGATIQDDVLTTQSYSAFNVSGTIETTAEQLSLGCRVPLLVTMTNNGPNLNQIMTLYVNDEIKGYTYVEAEAGDTVTIALSYQATHSGENEIRLVIPWEDTQIIAAKGYVYVRGDETVGILSHSLASPKASFHCNPHVTPLFDLQGRRLNAEPKHGVYIRNGKKVVK